MFVLPALILVCGFLLYPFAYNLILSFEKTDPYTLQNRYVGLDNYKAFLTSQRFWAAATRTVVFSLGTAIGSLIFGMILAMAIHSLEFKYKTVFLALLFIPWIIGFVETGLIAKLLLHPVLGPIGRALSGSLGQFASVLGNPNTALLAVTGVHIWKHVPFMLVNGYAALQTVPKEEYDAARIDGASSLEVFKYITIPEIRPVVGATLLLIVIWQFGAFTLFDVLTAGGPVRSTEVLTYSIFLSHSERSFGDAATQSILLFLFSVVLIVVYTRLEFRHFESE